MTGELQPWGNFLLRKGVIGDTLRTIRLVFNHRKPFGLSLRWTPCAALRPQRERFCIFNHLV